MTNETMKTISLDHGKYEFDINTATGLLVDARRYGEPWNAGFQDLRFSNPFMSALSRISDLESQVLSQQVQEPVAQWQVKLRNPILPECDVWINVAEEGARSIAMQHPDVYEVRALYTK